MFIKSHKQPHYPMGQGEARECLHDLVIKVAIGIRDLHSHGWAHQDIKLDNICFTIEYQSILIDLDRVCCVTASPAIYHGSCMYRTGFTACQMDWMQLGWLAAWAYCRQDTDYHTRTFVKLPEDCRSDTFLWKLITQGICTCMTSSVWPA